MNLSTLRSRRLELGLSQSELAEMAGISQAAVARYEAGKRSPRASHLAKLACALDLGMADLMAEPASQGLASATTLSVPIAPRLRSHLTAIAKTGLHGDTLEQVIGSLVRDGARRFLEAHPGPNGISSSRGR